MRLFTTILAFSLFSLSLSAQHLLKDIGAGNGNTEVIAFESTENNVSTDSLAVVFRNEGAYNYQIGLLSAAQDSLINAFEVTSYDIGEIKSIHYFKGSFYIFSFHNNSRLLTRYDMSGSVLFTDSRPANNAQEVEFIRIFENSSYLMFFESYNNMSFFLSINASGSLFINYQSNDFVFIQNASLISEKVFFNGNHPTYSEEPYVADGSYGGTFPLKDLKAGLYNSHPGNFTKGPDDLIYFTALSDGSADNGYKVFHTDGTTSGTNLTFNNPSDHPGLYPSSMQFTGAKLIIQSNPRLFAYDKSNNSLVDLFGRDVNILGQIAYSGQVYFVLAEDLGAGVYQIDLWKTNGTIAGTTFIKNLIQQTSFSLGRFWANTQGIFIQIKNNNSVSYPSQVKYFFSDGTAIGTKNLSEQNNQMLSQSTEMAFGIFDDKLIIRDYLPLYGFEILSHGGTGSWQVVRDVNQNIFGSNPGVFFNAGDKVFFMASDNLHGRELWQTDLTSGTVSPLFDWVKFNTHFTDGNSPQQSRTDFAAIEDGFYYVHPIDQQLIKYQVSTNSQSVIRDNVFTMACCSPNAFLQRSLAAFNNGLLFSNESYPFGAEPWYSDGTAGGTIMLTDANASGSSFPAVFTQLNASTSIFVTENPKAFWKTNGTPAGTQMISYYPSDIYFYSDQKPLIRQGKAYLTAVNFSTGNNESWSIGESSAQKLNGEALPILANPAAVVSGNSFFYLGVNANQQTIFELTESDVIQPVVNLPAYGSNLVSINNEIYFCMSDLGETWLYKLAGSSITKVTKIFSSLVYCRMYPLGNSKCLIQFSHFTDTNQNHFVLSDGTDAGTQEIFVHDGNNYMGETFFADNKLFFNYTTESSGSEPWILDISCPNDVIITSLSQESGRYDSGNKIVLNTQVKNKTELNASNKIELNPGTLIPGEKPFKAEIRNCEF